MKKAFDQTVRDLKREVNKSVLKVPRIEQKILDATSNEPWGPHGSHLAEIAQATKNYHEYQIIMSVIWKRINDTGKNWRHVYKGLTVLEYLVAHGSERVIDEIREHAYQISTLSDFQYIDSRGKDQGNNVRRKSQSLVALVNDKERIQEVRQKAFANKDKYQTSTGGMHRSGSGGGFGDRYDDDRYENRYRDDDQNGYPRDRDEDRYGRGRDSYSNDGDRYGRDPDRNGRDGYKDDDRQGRTRDEDFQFGSRSKSVDRYRGRSFDDDDRYSSRSGGGRTDDASHDERQSGSKPPEKSAAAPPSYEEAVKSAEGHIPEERDEKASVTANESTLKVAAPPPKVTPPVETTSRPTTTSMPMPANGTEADGFDEFDPRGFAPAPAAAKSVEMDLFGSFSAEDSLNSLALVPVTYDTTTSETDVSSTSGFGGSFVAMPSASSALDQPSNNPFGDAPFQAIPQNGFSAQPQSAPSFVSSQPDLASANSSGIQPTVAPKVETSSGFDFEDSFYSLDASSSFQQPLAAPATTTTPSVSNDLESMFATSNMTAESFPSQFTSGVPPVRSQTAPPELLAQSLPQAPQSASPNPFGQPGMSSQVPPSYPSAQPGLPTQMSQPGPQPQMSQPPGLPPQMVQPGMQTQMAQPGLSTQMTQPGQPSQMALPGQQSQMIPQNQFARPGLPSAASAPNLLGQYLMTTPSASQVATSTTSGLPPKSMQPKDKFETKSTVWTDTLSRGLVNLNISGPKTNPLADIGVDFESINRKEKMKVRDQNATPISTITMGKAMGSGSGIGRSGASGTVPQPNPMMNPGMGMGGGGMGGYGGGMNPNMGMGGGYAGGMNQSMGMGAIRPGGPGMPQVPGMPGGGYNPMMNMGGYGSQQPYGGGYR